MKNFDLRKYLAEGKLLKEHTVTFSKEEMATLHNDGKLIKKDEEGKDHTYVYSEGEVKLEEFEDMRPKDIEFEKAKEEERLANHPEEETIRKIQAMFADEKSLKEDDDKIKDLESQLDFHTQMDNMGRASIIKDKIEKLRKLSNSGEIDGDEFLDKFNPLSKELKSLDESKISSYEKQLKIAYDALEKAEKDGDVRKGELALAAIDLINDEIDSYFKSKLQEQPEIGVIGSAKLALKAMPMSDVYIKSLESDVEKNGEGGYVDFRKDDWVEDYSEFIVDKLDS